MKCKFIVEKAVNLDFFAYSESFLYPILFFIEKYYPPIKREYRGDDYYTVPEIEVTINIKDKGEKKMIEGKLGGIIYYNDKGSTVKLKVVKSSECTGCYFKDKDCGYFKCRSAHRKDMKNIIYQKINIEYDIGYIFTYYYNGDNIKIKVVEGRDCTRCFLLGKECCDILCQDKYRKDKRDVHFIEIKE